VRRAGVDIDRWFGRLLPKRYGTWPGGLRCALTTDPERKVGGGLLPLEVWTAAVEHLIFQEHRADRDLSRS
jgi:hypothetical protein